MKIREAIVKRAIIAVGGVKSKAYSDMQIAELVIKDIKRMIAREFGVNNFEDIPFAPIPFGTDAEEYILTVIDEYELPLWLIDRIEEKNS